MSGEIKVESDEMAVTKSAVEAVVRSFHEFVDTTNEVNRAYALTRLNDAVSDLSSWHPAYNYEIGEIEL